MDEPKIEYAQFDVVRLVHIKNVKYLSGPPGRVTSPKGEWTIVGFVDRDAVLAKQSTLIRVPVGDVVRIAEYDKRLFYSRLAQASKPGLDVAQAIAKEFNMPYQTAKAMLVSLGLPLLVDKERYLHRAIARVKRSLNKTEAPNGNEGQGQEERESEGV